MNITMTRVRQDFPRPRVHDVRAATRAEARAVADRVPRGGEVAIAVGSRGIANLAAVVTVIVEEVATSGAKPFIVPAMGSHGGATAEGQEAVLATYGISESTVGAPVRSSMEVVQLQEHGLGHPVYMDRQAAESDGVILVNRVKPHTDYHGHPESGLMKMSVIGLGKHAQALAIHSRGINGLKELIAPTSRVILETGKILFGIALVENAFDETMTVRGILPENIEMEERRLLEVARENMPSLPTDDIDLLIVDEIGKDISGTGMDPNIIGRIRVRGQDEPSRPVVRSIVARDLTSGTHGNAIGVGLAEVITRRLYDRIDFAATYENVITSTFLERGKIPIVAENDRNAVEVGLRAAAVLDCSAARIVRIKNTLHLQDIWVSPTIARELSRSRRDDIHLDSRSEAPLIDEDGNLPRLFEPPHLLP